MEWKGHLRNIPEVGARAEKCVDLLKEMYADWFLRGDNPPVSSTGERGHTIWNEWVEMCSSLQPVDWTDLIAFNHVGLAIGPSSHTWLCHGDKFLRRRHGLIRGSNEQVGENSLRKVALLWNKAGVGFRAFSLRAPRLLRLCILSALGELGPSAASFNTKRTRPKLSRMPRQKMRG